MSYKKGMFIVLEGIDGAGKSTIGLKLKDYLEDQGHSVWLTHEPTEYYEKESKMVFFDSTKLQLLLRDIRYHTKEIRRQLACGVTVVCDRYYYSNIAYQGMEYGVDNLRLINESVAIAPDIAFYLRIDPKTSFERKGEYNIPFLNKVVAIYDEMEFDYWHRIDAEQSVDSVFSGIKAVLEEGR